MQLKRKAPKRAKALWYETKLAVTPNSVTMTVEKTKRPQAKVRNKALWVALATPRPPLVREPVTPLPRQNIRRASKARAAGLRRYQKAAKAFVAAKGVCQSCRIHNAHEVHHKRGRAGRLLHAEQHWLALCHDCHVWIHQNPRAAARAGLIAGPGEWGKL